MAYNLVKRQFRSITRQLPDMEIYTIVEELSLKKKKIKAPSFKTFKIAVGNIREKILF